jgi:hypothetical protein
VAIRGKAYAFRCPTSLKLMAIDASELTWEISEGYAGKVVIKAESPGSATVRRTERR